jgi:hypothetical protein
MALQKDIVFKEVVLSYHKILAIWGEFAAVNPNSNEYTSINVKVASYKDATTRALDVENYIRLKEYHYLAGQVDAPTNEHVEKAYKALKKLPEFEGAIDV